MLPADPEHPELVQPRVMGHEDVAAHQAGSHEEDTRGHAGRAQGGAGELQEQNVLGEIVLFQRFI